MTYYPIISTELESANEQEAKIIQSTGAGPKSILICKIDSGKGAATTESHRWVDKTLQIASEYIENNFYDLVPG